MAEITEEFVIPSFLGTSDEDEIHESMLENLPDEFDKSEGQVTYDLTRPSANIAARIKGYEIPEALKLIVPLFSNGIYLDYHGEMRRLYRNQATYATGTLTIGGAVGTVIPKGSLFSTEAKNGVASVDYATLTEVTIGAEETVSVQAQCTIAGVDGNAGANQVVVKSNEIDDISSVTNTTAFSGGYDEEDDDSYKERIMSFEKSLGTYNTGTEADYKRWCMSVNGVGYVKVYPNTDDNEIRLHLFDKEYYPLSVPRSTTDISYQVYDYLYGISTGQRYVPINVACNIYYPTITKTYLKAGIQYDTSALETMSEDEIFSAINKEFCKKFNEYTATNTTYDSQSFTIRLIKLASLLLSCKYVKELVNIKYILNDDTHDPSTTEKAEWTESAAESIVMGTNVNSICCVDESSVYIYYDNGMS